MAKFPLVSAATYSANLSIATVAARAWRDARTGVDRGSRAYDNRRYDEGAVFDSVVVRQCKRPVITRGYR